MVRLTIVSTGVALLLGTSVAQQNVQIHNVPGYASATNLPNYAGYPIRPNNPTGAVPADANVLGGMQAGGDPAVFECDLYVPGPASLAQNVQTQLISQGVAYSVNSATAVTTKKAGGADTAYNKLQFTTFANLLKKAFDVYKSAIAASNYGSVNDLFAKGLRCRLVDFVNEELNMDMLMRLPVAQGSEVQADFETLTEALLFGGRRRRLQSSFSSTSLLSPFSGVPELGGLRPLDNVGTQATRFTYSPGMFNGISTLPAMIGTNGISGISTLPAMIGTNGISGISTLPAMIGTNGISGISTLPAMIGTNRISGISTLPAMIGTNGISGISTLPAMIGTNGISGISTLPAVIGTNGISGISTLPALVGRNSNYGFGSDFVTTGFQAEEGVAAVAGTLRQALFQAHSSQSVDLSSGEMSALDAMDVSAKAVDGTASVALILPTVDDAVWTTRAADNANAALSTKGNTVEVAVPANQSVRFEAVAINAAGKVVNVKDITVKADSA